MTVRRKLEYFFLQYAPDALADECINVGLVLFDPSSESGFCMARFAANWATLVRSIDPEADVEVLTTAWADFKQRLCDPGQRTEMLQIMEGSFSNSIRVSSRRECYCEDAASQIEALANCYLRAL